MFLQHQAKLDLQGLSGNIVSCGIHFLKNSCFFVPTFILAKHVYASSNPNISGSGFCFRIFFVLFSIFDVSLKYEQKHKNRIFGHCILCANHRKNKESSRRRQRSMAASFFLPNSAHEITTCVYVGSDGANHSKAPLRVQGHGC